MEIKSKRKTPKARRRKFKEPVQVEAQKIKDTLVDIDKIRHHEDMEERQDKGDLVALYKSIEVLGLLQPICCVEKHGETYLVAGDRRLTCIKELRQKNPVAFKRLFGAGVPTRMLQGSLTTSQLSYLAENIAREEVDHCLIAKAIHRLRTTMSTASIASATGLSQTMVRDHVRFWQMASSRMKESVRKGTMTYTYALEMLKMREKPGEIQKARPNPNWVKKSAVVKDKFMINTVAKNLLGASFRDTSSVTYTKAQAMYMVAKSILFARYCLSLSEFREVMDNPVKAFEKEKADRIGLEESNE